jgi:DNA-binding MarR family transcriptional regulator
VSEREQALARPVGWWLKEADAALDAAFDAALEGAGVDRRGWQVLASLARAPTTRADLIAALAGFDPPAAVGRVLDDAIGRGWVEESAGLLQLTSAGRAQQQAVAPRVDGVREQVSAALPQDDYVLLVGLLARLVEGVRAGVTA